MTIELIPTDTLTIKHPYTQEDITLTRIRAVDTITSHLKRTNPHTGLKEPQWVIPAGTVGGYIQTDTVDMDNFSFISEQVRLIGNVTLENTVITDIEQPALIVGHHGHLRMAQTTLAHIQRLAISASCAVGSIQAQLIRVYNHEATAPEFPPMKEFTVSAHSSLKVIDSTVTYKVNLHSLGYIMLIINSHLGDKNCPTELTNINLLSTSYANGHAFGQNLNDKNHTGLLTLDNCHFRGVSIRNRNFPNPYIVNRTLIDPYYDETMNEGEDDYVTPRFVYDERTALVQMDLFTHVGQPMTLSLLKYQTDHPDLTTVTPWVIAGCWHGSLDDFEAMIASETWRMTPRDKTHLYRPVIEAQIKVLRTIAESWPDTRKV